MKKIFCCLLLFCLISIGCSKPEDLSVPTIDIPIITPSNTYNITITFDKSSKIATAIVYKNLEKVTLPVVTWVVSGPATYSKIGVDKIQLGFTAKGTVLVYASYMGVSDTYTITVV